MIWLYILLYLIVSNLVLLFLDAKYHWSHDTQKRIDIGILVFIIVISLTYFFGIVFNIYMIVRGLCFILAKIFTSDVWSIVVYDGTKNDS